MFASNQPHIGSWKPGDEIVVFQLSQRLVSEIRDELSSGANCHLIPADIISDAVLEGLGHFVRDKFQKPEKLGDLLVESVGYIATRHLLQVHVSDRMSNKPTNALSADELRKVRRYVAENLQQGFSAREMASALKLGPALFAEKLKVSTGLSPWRYVQDYRIDAAKVQLHHKQKPISQVAEELGFADQSHFTNSFREATGLTPKAYRSKL
jgi:AraC family transcriptional regulator